MDETLYSRQLITIGKDAMTKLLNTKVIVSGMSGLGLEVAKCIILSGVSEVLLHDLNDTITYNDLATTYYLTEDDLLNKKQTSPVKFNINLLNFIPITIFSIWWSLRFII